MKTDAKKWTILLQHLRDGYATAKEHKYELNEAIDGIKALEAECDELLDCVKNYVDRHGTSCLIHEDELDPECTVCQIDIAINQALTKGGNDGK